MPENVKYNLQNKGFMKKKLISPIFYIALPIYLIISLALERAKVDVAFADRVNGGISQAVRRFMASLSTSVDFSIFEVLVISIPALIILLIFVAARRFKRGEGRLRLISALLAIIMLLLSGNTLCLGFGYRTSTLRENLGLEYVEINENRLAEALIFTRDELNSLSEKIDYNENGISIGHDLDTASALICESFDSLSAEYPFFDNFDSRAKYVKNGWAMAMLGISGIYTYYTGESNVNSAFPPAETCFTAAHELSHQRGIMRENEANFMAFLVTSTSPDLYLNYSAYLSMYQYLASALYRTNKDRYFEIHRDLAEGPRGDIAESNRVVQKYANTPIADLSASINDIFLKSNGTAGIITYGEVVKLTVAYYHDLGIIS